VTGIDALLDSDEDGAEIFNDCESDDDDEDGDGAISMVSDSQVSGSVAAAIGGLSPSRQRDFQEAMGASSSFLQVGGIPGTVVKMDGRESSDDDDDDDDDRGESSDVGTASEEDGDDDDDKSNSESAEDYSDDEDEGEDGYKPGGYHPVKVGEVYNQRCVLDRSYAWTKRRSVD
jgi:hypothetical protein